MSNPTHGMAGKSNGKSQPVVRPNHRPFSVVRWSDIDHDVIAGIVQLVTVHNGAVMFGCTADGGAYSLCILDGTNKIKEYPHTAQEVTDILGWLRDEYFG